VRVDAFWRNSRYPRKVAQALRMQAAGRSSGARRSVPSLAFRVPRRSARALAVASARFDLASVLGDAAVHIGGGADIVPHGVGCRGVHRARWPVPDTLRHKRADRAAGHRRGTVAHDDL